MIQDVQDFIKNKIEATDTSLKQEAESMFTIEEYDKLELLLMHCVDDSVLKTCFNVEIEMIVRHKLTKIKNFNRRCNPDNGSAPSSEFADISLKDVSV